MNYPNRPDIRRNGWSYHSRFPALFCLTGVAADDSSVSVLRTASHTPRALPLGHGNLFHVWLDSSHLWFFDNAIGSHYITAANTNKLIFISIESIISSMQEVELEKLFSLVEEGSQPTPVRKGVMERLRHADSQQREENIHRIQKLERSVRRELELNAKGRE